MSLQILNVRILQEVHAASVSVPETTMLLNRDACLHDMFVCLYSAIPAQGKPHPRLKAFGTSAGSSTTCG